MTAAYFGAVETLSRAQFAAVLYRMAGEPEVEEKQIFPDVPVNTETAWYAKAVAWANENKIILGYKNGNFGPADSITREQMVVMMYRYAESHGHDLSKAGGSLEAFPDAGKVSGWAKDAMEWAVGCGIITGDGGTFQETIRKNRNLSDGDRISQKGEA